jgi:hypothetical protein
MMETKACGWCGSDFQRKKWMKPGDWSKAHHCSISCGRKAAWDGKRAEARYCSGCGVQLKSARSKRCHACARGTLRERFQAKVEKFDGCWFWLGRLSDAGYGEISVEGRPQLAHRISFELEGGEIPKGFHLDHLCRNPSCVNPAHLDPVPPVVNNERGLNGVLKETCANGHPWIPENWSRNGKGRKMCAICHRERVRAYKQKKREERVVSQ